MSNLSLRSQDFRQHGSSSRESSAEGVEPRADCNGNPVLSGHSLAARRLRSQVERVAPYLRTALLCGESGAGKELVARAIHSLAVESTGPFLRVDSSALAEALAAGETPAASTPLAGQPEAPSANRLIDAMQGGTLYLSGIGEVPYACQGSLVHFLETCGQRRGAVPQEFHAAGHLSRGLRRPATRIVAGTHRDLRVLTAIGQFRHDLYTRLAAVEIPVPSLRERLDDLATLAAWLLQRHGDRAGRHAQGLSPQALDHLRTRPWPDNLRQLDQVVAQAAALADGAQIELRHLLAFADAASNQPAALAQPRVERLQDVIERHVLDVLTRCGGNKLRAAELLGISRSTLYRMIDASTNGLRALTE